MKAGKSTLSVIKFAWIVFVTVLLIFVAVSRSRSHDYHAASSKRATENRRVVRSDVYADSLEIVNSLPEHGHKYHVHEESPQLTLRYDLPGVERTDDGTFKLDLNAHKYPTVSDWMNGAKDGTYQGMEYHVLSAVRPRAFLVRKVLDDADSDELIRIASASMARSEVVHAPGSSGVNSIRTSFGMFINGRDAYNAANVKLRRQAAAFVGCPEENVESTQILRYYAGQFYRAHPDYFSPGSEHLSRGGQRYATMLTWLNYPGDKGAETEFPTAGIRVRPVRNAAVLFYSMDINGAIDPHSMHAALPPEGKDVKWVAVNWIRQHRFT